MNLLITLLCALTVSAFNPGVTFSLDWATLESGKDTYM